MPRARWRTVLLWLLAGTLLAGPGTAGAEDLAPRAALERSVRFLQDAQNHDGGFGAEVGDPSDPGFSAWAAYALAAAGINPRDQARPAGIDVHSYLAKSTMALFQTTDFDRAALVAIASGTSPSDFGGVDAIATVLSRQLPDGSFPQFAGSGSGWVNATIWSIFPLSAVSDPAAEAAVAAAAQWLLDRQLPDGGWPATTPSSPADADMTGAAIQALRAAGRGGGEAERLALEFLHRAQRLDGGFEAMPGAGSNAATTAWVVQGMWAAGVDPRSWRTSSGRDPLSYLASLQRPDGSIGYTATSSTNALWITAQVGPALAGRAYPLAAVPRRAAGDGDPPPEPPTLAAPPDPPPLPAARPGEGGMRAGRGAGVIAGGGGRGAPLFSAPRPQSTGTTPGGARRQHATSAPPPARARAGAGGAGAGIAATDSATGAGGETVEGLLVAGRGTPAAAPGLFGAGRGGDPERGLAAGLVVALLAAAALGAWRERLGRAAA